MSIMERKYSPGYRHMICIGKTELASEKGLLPVGLMAQLVEVRGQIQFRPEIFRSCFVTTAVIMLSCCIC